MYAPRSYSEDGIEIHWAVNHLGHYLLTKLLKDQLMGGRVLYMIDMNYRYVLVETYLCPIRKYIGLDKIHVFSLLSCHPAKCFFNVFAREFTSFFKITEMQRMESNSMI